MQPEVAAANQAETEIEAREVKVGSKQGREAVYYTPKFVLAPGTPMMVSLIMDILSSLKCRKPTTVFVIPEKYLRDPRPTAFARTVRATEKPWMVAWSTMSVRLLEPEEIQAYAEAAMAAESRTSAKKAMPLGAVLEQKEGQ